MKWQAIANLTSQVNEEAKGYLNRKLQKDASVQIPNLWSDFITDTARHLRASESNLEVSDNEKTGGLSCLTSFDALHEDFLENKKPFLEYVLGKYDQRAAGYLGNVKNPYTKRFLEEKIGSYRMHLAQQVSDAEIKLIDGKRHNLAIAAIEKLKSAAYDNPELYSSFLDDSIVAISDLSLLPQEKDKLQQSAKEDLAYAAALGMMKRSPEIIVDSGALPTWKVDLSFEQRIRLEQQASSLLHHRQLMMQKQVMNLAESHFSSILKTGKGVSGFDGLLRSSFSSSDPKLHYLLEKEALHKEAFFIAQQLKAASFSEGDKLLKQFAPQAGDPNYAWQEKIHHILALEFNRHIKAAETDPAKFVEDLFSEEIPEDSPLPQRLLLRRQLQEQKGIPTYKQRYLMEAEQDSYLQKLQGEDSNEIRQVVDNIMAIGKGEYQIGLELLAEVLQDQEKLASAIHFYAENQLFAANSKARADLANTFAQMIPLQKQLFSSSSNQEKKELDQEIKNNKIINLWYHDTVLWQPHNLKEVEFTLKGIKDLARFYQLNLGLNASRATEKAANMMINEVYMPIFDNLQIPKQIIQNGYIRDLNAEYIKKSLIKIRRNLIQGYAQFDYITTFGRGSQLSEGIEKGDPIAEKIATSLANGRWFLSPDKKNIYYAYQLENGEFRALMKNSVEKLSFNLVELNIPESEVDKQERFGREMEELLELTLESKMR